MEEVKNNKKIESHENLEIVYTHSLMKIKEQYI